MPDRKPVQQQDKIKGRLAGRLRQYANRLENQDDIQSQPYQPLAPPQQIGPPPRPANAVDRSKLLKPFVIHRAY